MAGVALNGACLACGFKMGRACDGGLVRVRVGMGGSGGGLFPRFCGGLRRPGNRLPRCTEGCADWRQIRWADS